MPEAPVITETGPLAASGGRPRFWPPFVLVLLAFLVAELLPGSAPLTKPALWPFLILIYGPGALLIRESVRRRHRGWASILLLGTAYGFVEEGLALQSLFNPALYRAAEWGGRVFGINGVYALTAIPIHAVWSAAIPILLTDLLFPGRREEPYLGRIGLVLTGIWYILGAALLALIARSSIAPGYQARSILLGLTALMVLALVVVALVILPRTVARPERDANAPQPWVVLLAIFVASLVWHILLALLWRIDPVFGKAPFVLARILAALAVLAAVAWLLNRWAISQGWNDRHRLAVVVGAVISHSLFGAAIFAKTAGDRVALAGLWLVAMVLLILFANRIRERAGSQIAGARSSSIR